MAPCEVVNWWGGGGVLSHSALAEVEGGAELLVGDSEGVLVHVREGVVGRAHVGGKVGADELWGGVGVAGFGLYGRRVGLTLRGIGSVDEERVHWYVVGRTM